MWKWTFNSDTFGCHTFASGNWRGRDMAKFPGDTDWTRAGVGDAEVAAKSGEPGDSDWSQAGVGAVSVAARES